MAVAEKVVVELVAKNAEFKKNLAESRAVFNANASQIEARNNAMTQRVRANTLILGTAIGSFIGSILGQMVSGFARAAEAGLEYAGSLGETAQQLGVSSKALQEWRFIGAQVGVETEQMDRALGFLTKTLGQVEVGAKKPTLALKDLGFSAKEIAEIAHNGTGPAMDKLVAKFSAIEDPVRRARDEVALFGKTGQKLDVALAGGTDEVNRLKQEITDLGGVLSDEQIQQADKTADKLRELQDVLKAQIGGAVAANSSAIIGLAQSIVTLIGAMGRAIPMIQQFFHHLSAAEHNFNATAFEALHTGFGPLSLPDSLIPGKQAQNQRYIQSERAKADAEQKAADKIRDDTRRNALGDRFASTVTGGGHRVTNADVDIVDKALKAKGAGGGKSAKEKADEAQQKLDRFYDQQAQLLTQINSALAEVAGTAEARVAAEKLNLDIEAASEKRRIDHDKDYTALQKQELDAKVDHATALKKEAIDIAESVRKTHESFLTQQAINQNEQDALHAQEGLTDSREERLRIEKRLVDLAIDQEEAAQREIIATSKNADEIERAQQRLAALPGLRASGQAAMERQNQSPFQSYVSNLRTEMDNVNDTLESIEVQAIQSLEDHLAGATAKALGLNGALGDILTSLLRIGIKEAELAIFGGNGGKGGLFSGLGKLLGIGGTSFGSLQGGFDYGSALDFSTTLPHFAGGGSIKAGQASIVGESGQELFIPATNGMILPNSALKRGASRVEVLVVANDYFDARVGQVTGPVIAQASMRAAVGGASISRRNLAIESQHRLE